MKNIIFFVSVAVSTIIPNYASAASETPSSAAYIQQVSGTSFSSLDTAAIMKPVFEMASLMQTVSRPQSGNLANSLQVGDYNVANIEQVGVGNVGFIYQAGQLNTASISQTGMSNQAFVSQRGNNNVAIIRQR